MESVRRLASSVKDAPPCTLGVIAKPRLISLLGTDGKELSKVDFP